MSYTDAAHARHETRETLARLAQDLADAARGDVPHRDVLRAAWLVRTGAQRFSDAMDAVEVEKHLGREAARTRLGFLS